MKNTFTILALLLFTFNVAIKASGVLNSNLSTQKSFNTQHVAVWKGVGTKNITEFLPSISQSALFTKSKPASIVTSIPSAEIIHETEPEIPPQPLNESGTDLTVTKHTETLSADNREVVPAKQPFSNYFAYDLDRNYENLIRNLNSGELETDETMLWYAKTEHYENAVNWNKTPVDQKTNLKRLNGKIQNKSFITPETMLLVTGVEYFAASSKYTIDFSEPEQAKTNTGDISSQKDETLYCINRKFYDEDNFSIADCVDLLDIDDFECDETTWHTFSELDKSIEVSQGQVGVINVLAKKPDGSFIVYDRLFFRWLMMFHEEPITCTYFMMYYLWGGGWVILNDDIDCTGEDFALSRDEIREKIHIIGNGHVVKNINISESSCWSLGMLGGAEGNSYVANLGIETASLDAGCNSGVLFGRFEDSLIENVYVKGAELTTGNGAGGLVGLVTHSRIRKVRTEDLDFTAGSWLGGIAETMYEGSVVEDSEVKSSQLNIDGQHVGGVTGVLSGSTILRTRVEGVVVVGGYNAGGLVGTAMDAVVSYSKSSGSVEGSGYNFYETDGIGGLIGSADNSSVTYSSSSVAVSSGEDINNTGGLIGYVNETSHVEHCSASGDVTSLYYFVGGLIGYLANEEYDVQSTVLSNSYATGDVTGSLSVGGLLGRAEATIINNVSAKGTVTSNYTNSVGAAAGLIGFLVDSELYNSFAIGDVTACTLSTVTCDCIGGLVGALDGVTYDPKIENSYALGDVVGTERTGSLVGSLPGNATFNNGYALGSVVGSGQYVGGVFGYRNQNAVVNNVYSLYPDTSSGVTLLTEEEFGNESSFIGFNFPNTWEMQNRMMCYDIPRRPHLSWEPPYDNKKVCKVMQHNTQR